MPNFAGNGKATLLNTNTQKYAWKNESVSAATASIAFQLERQKSAFYPFGVSVAILFSGTPGAFEVNVQTADLDEETSYVTISTVTSVNSNNAARVELSTLWARYIRVKIVTLTNAVNTTVLITR